MFNDFASEDDSDIADMEGMKCFFFILYNIIVSYKFFITNIFDFFIIIIIIIISITTYTRRY